MRLLAIAFLAMFSSLPLASCADADVERLMQEYWWQNRVLLVFSPDAGYAPYQQQNAMLDKHSAAWKERDLVIWRFVRNESVSVDGEAKVNMGTPMFYEYFDVSPDSFTVLLIGKDGEEKLRQSDVVSKNALTELIDAMPMRQREMREQ